MEGTMSEIRYFAADFQPKNWAYCQGQTLAINTNQALFSLLGTTYGGNGVTTFCLPDFRSRTPVGTGQAGGINAYQLGEPTGTESTVMTINQLPAHNHPGTAPINIPAFSEGGTTPSPSGNILASLTGLYANTAANTVLATISAVPTISIAGSNQPIPLIQPYLAMNAIICLYGIFPSRN
jgi:microcystin-dependent protein